MVRLKLPVTKLVISNWRNELNVSLLPFGKTRAAAPFHSLAYLAIDTCDTNLLVKQLEKRLPGYMVPRNVRVIKEIPLNANGKYDRKALLAMLEAEVAER